MTEDFDPAQFDPDERAEIAAQTPVMSAAWRFITPALQNNDLAAAWPAVDPSLQLCWAQSWLDLNRVDVAADGYDLDKVAVAFTDDPPSHPLWRHFSRVLLRDLHGVADLDPDTWGIGGNARLLAVDIDANEPRARSPSKRSAASSAGSLTPSTASSSPMPNEQLARVREGTAGRLKNPARSTFPRTSTLRISHFPDPQIRRYNRNGQLSYPTRPRQPARRDDAPEPSRWGAPPDERP